MSLINKTRNQKGVILLMTLLILSSILVVTLAAADLVMVGLKMNRLTGYSSLAFSAAEAGLERALWTARKTNYSYPKENESNVLSCPGAGPACPIGNDSSYLVAYATSTPSAGFITFTSVGSFSGVKRSVQSTYEVQ